MSRSTKATPSSINSIFNRIRSFRHHLDRSTASTTPSVSDHDHDDRDDHIDPIDPHPSNPVQRQTIEDQSIIPNQPQPQPPKYNISTLSSLPTISPLRSLDDTFDDDSMFQTKPKPSNSTKRKRDPLIQSIQFQSNLSLLSKGSDRSNDSILDPFNNTVDTVDTNDAVGRMTNDRQRQSIRDPFKSNLSTLSNPFDDTNECLEMPMTPKQISSDSTISSSNVITSKQSSVERARSNLRHRKGLTLPKSSGTSLSKLTPMTPLDDPNDRIIASGDRLGIPISADPKRSQRSKRSKVSNFSISSTITPSMGSNPNSSFQNVFEKLQSFRVSLDDTPKGTSSNEWRKRRQSGVTNLEISSLNDLNLTMPSFLQSRNHSDRDDSENERVRIVSPSPLRESMKSPLRRPIQMDSPSPLHPSLRPSKSSKTSPVHPLGTVTTVATTQYSPKKITPKKSNLCFESQIIANIPSHISPKRKPKPTAKATESTEEKAIDEVVTSKHSKNSKNSNYPNHSNAIRKSQRLDMMDLMSLPSPPGNHKMKKKSNDSISKSPIRDGYRSQIRQILQSPPSKSGNVQSAAPQPVSSSSHSNPNPLQREEEEESSSVSPSPSHSPSRLSRTSSNAIQIAEAMASHRNAMPHYYYTSPSVISDTFTIPTHLLTQSVVTKENKSMKSSITKTKGQEMSLQEAFRKHRQSVDLKQTVRRKQKVSNKKANAAKYPFHQLQQRRKSTKFSSNLTSKPKQFTKGRKLNRYPLNQRNQPNQQIQHFQHIQHGQDRRGRDSWESSTDHIHHALCGCSCHGEGDDKSRTPLVSPSKDREEEEDQEIQSVIHKKKGSKSLPHRGKRRKRRIQNTVMSPQIAVEIKRKRRRKGSIKSNQLNRTKRKTKAPGPAMSELDSEAILEEHAQSALLNLSGGIIQDLVRLSAISPSPIWFNHRQKLHIQEIRSHSKQYMIISTVCCALWTKHKLEVLKLFKLSWSQRIMAFAEPSVMFYVVDKEGTGNGVGSGGARRRRNVGRKNMAKQLFEIAENRFEGLDYVEMRYRLNSRRHQFALMCIVDAYYIVNETNQYFIDHRHCIPSYLIRNKS